MKAEKLESLRDEIDEWFDHPITKLIHQFYQDSRAETMHRHAELIGSGGTTDMESQIRDSESCRVLDQLSRLEFDDIESFYSES